MSSKFAATPVRQALVERLLFLGQMQSTETAHFHQTAAAQNNLNITDSKTISVLIQEGSMTAGELAVRLSLTSGAVTSVIDRLETAGFVARTRDPEDGRRVIVSLNYQHSKRLGKTYASMGRSFEKLLGSYSTEELAMLADFFERVIEMTKQETRKLGHSD